MPLTKLACQSCGEEFSRFISMGKTEGLACPACGGTEIKKALATQTAQVKAEPPAMACDLSKRS